MKVFRMFRNELGRFWPERGDRLRCVIEIDCEPVGLIVVCHVAEDIVVNITEEMDLWLYSPVELCVCQSRVLVEETTVPSAHLMVGFHTAILNIILLQDTCRFLEQLFVDPRRNLPVFLGNQLCE